MAIINGLKNLAKSLKDTWGRSVDKEDSYAETTMPPQSNPDPTTSEQRFDTSSISVIKAAEQYTDVARLFVTAKGFTPKENGVYYPAQLIYPVSGGDDEVLAALALQYDAIFEGGFQPIIRSLDNPCKTEGYCIAETEWFLKDDAPYRGKMFARFVWSRDPRGYIFDYEGEEGIYKDDDFSDPKRMNPTAFLSYAHDPLYNNKYGRAKNRPLQPWLNTWIEVFDDWRKGLEHAGYGFIVGKYSHMHNGKDAESERWRTEYLKKVLEFGAGKGGIIEDGNDLELQQIQIEAGIYLEWYTELKKDVSLLHTGSETGLIEGKYGTYAGTESGEVRERSYIEMMNAARVCGFWNRWNKLWCEINFPPERIKVIPKLQLIPPGTILPTTPKDQEEIDQGDGKIKPVQNIGNEKPEENKELASPEWGTYTGTGDNATAPIIYSDGTFTIVQELADEEETPDPPIPVAVPAGYENFPNKDPLPEEYRGSIDYAKESLADMPVKEYKDVTKDDAPYVFTVKRFRGYESDMLPILKDLKIGLEQTLDAPDEDAAWNDYYDNFVVPVLAKNGINVTPQIRNDLMISFKQTRANALNDGFFNQVQDDPGVVGLRIVNKEGVEHHLTDRLWNGVAIPKDHAELHRGGRLRIPLNFGCVCRYQKVYKAEELTPESEWPLGFPGETYKYYAQPDDKEVA